MLTIDPMIQSAPSTLSSGASTNDCRPKRSSLGAGESSRLRRATSERNEPLAGPLSGRNRVQSREHPLQHMDLCRIDRQGRISAATAAFVHALLTNAGRRPALLTSEGGLMAGRLFPQRPSTSDAPEWERLLATHVRSGGDCLVIEEDSEIEGLLAGVSPRSHLQPPTAPRNWIRPLALHWRGSRVEVTCDGGTPRTAHLPLVGLSNLRALDLALDRILQGGSCSTRILAGLPLLAPPTGLLEPVHAGQPFGVFVDRASSAADLAELIAEARTLSGRRILLVTGISGCSTPEERHDLGSAATAADEVILTADNPRHVSVASILTDLQSGLGGRGMEVPDRHAAITKAIRMARADDLVLIAGKGGHAVQEVGSAVIPWDDRLHARDALAGRGWVGDSL